MTWWYEYVLSTNFFKLLLLFSFSLAFCSIVNHSYQHARFIARMRLRIGDTLLWQGTHFSGLIFPGDTFLRINFSRGTTYIYCGGQSIYPWQNNSHTTSTMHGVEFMGYIAHQKQVHFLKLCILLNSPPMHASTIGNELKVATSSQVLYNRSTSIMHSKTLHPLMCSC